MVGFSLPYLSMDLKPELVSVMKEVKKALDPKGILNPGKKFV